MMWCVLVILCWCILHCANASKGNPNPQMLKGKMARLRVITSHSATKERVYGIRRARDLNRMLDFRIPVLKAIKPIESLDPNSLDTVNVMVRRVNTGRWFVGKRLALNDDETNLGEVVLAGGHRAADAQKILDKCIFDRLFGKRVGDLDFIAATRRREAGFATVKARDIEYGYQLNPNLPVLSLQQFAAKRPALKILPVPQICIENILKNVRRRDLLAEFPSALSHGIDQLINVIDATASPTLLVSSNGSAVMTAYDRRSVCTKAGGAVVLTPTSRCTKTESHLRDSLFIRISNLHYLTAEPPNPELAPGLAGLVVTALVLERYKQLGTEPPANLRLQVQSDSFTFLSDLRHHEDLVDPNEGENNRERNRLAMTYLAQRLYVNQTLYPPHSEEEEPITNTVPISTYLACEPVDKVQPEKWTIKEKSMWMADQLASPQLHRHAHAATIDPAARRTLLKFLPKWREDRVVEIDARDMLKWCANLWDIETRIEDVYH